MQRLLALLACAAAATVALLVTSSPGHTQGSTGPDGDITAVYAGSGLAGGSARGSATLRVNPYANGGLDFTGSQIGLFPCAAGDILKSAGGGDWTCESDLSGISNGSRVDINVVDDTTWNINPNVVTFAKMADLATSRFIGRVTAGTGDPEALTGTQATTLLDTFTSALKGLAPASGGGTTNYLRADGTWASPPGAGDITGVTTTAPLSGGCTTGTCALTTSVATNTFAGRITAGTGVIESLTPTQATSMLDTFTTTLKGLVPAPSTSSGRCLKDDGTWSACGGGTVVQTDSTTGTINDFPLGATTTMLVFTSGSSATLNGLTGGTDGRCIDIIFLGVGTLSFANEQGGSTTGNRIVTANTATWPTSPNAPTRVCYVGGSTNRWTISRDHRMSSLTTAGSINAGTTINASTNLTVAGSATLGDATTDSHTVNGTLSQFAGAGYYLARSAAVAQSQIQVDSNGTGMVALRGGGADDNAITFDLERFNSAWTAHDTSIAGITKRNDRLNFGCLNGTSNGTNVTTGWETSTAYDDCGYVDLATAGWTLPSATVSGAAALNGASNTFGDASSDVFTFTGVANLNAPGNTVNELAASGTVALNGTSNSIGNSASDTLNIVARFADKGTTPTISACGTSPSVAGGQWSFHITTGTGGPTSCTATFAQSCASSATCWVSPGYNPTGGGGHPYISATSATAVAIATSGTGWNNNILHVGCICH